MYLPIYFCADGVLRACNHNKPLIPLTFIQEYSEKKDDFSFWADLWKNNVYFEKGLTLSTFFTCLEPWADFFSTLTHVDIPIYLQEMRKPCAIENQSKFSYLEISTENIFIPELENLEKVNHLDIENLIVKRRGLEKRLMALSGLWEFNRRTSVCGYMNSKDNKDQKYGFHLSHPECYANVPLVLNDNIHTSFFNYTLNRYFGEDISIFNDNLTNVLVKESGITTIVSKKHFQFRELVEAFFKELRKTPQDFRDLDKLLHERMLSYMQTSKERSIEKEVEKTNSTNVVSIHKNNVEKNNQTEEKGVNFQMDPGFLKDLSALGSKESQLWDYLLKEAAKKDTVLRIGKIEQQEVPEIRICGHKIPLENYIKSTEPKLL